MHLLSLSHGNLVEKNEPESLGNSSLPGVWLWHIDAPYKRFNSAGVHAPESSRHHQLD
jgi:hypothetical protein